MTNNDTPGVKSHPTTSSNASPTRGSDTSDSRSSDDSRTSIGSGGSTRSDAREAEESSRELLTDGGTEPTDTDDSWATLAHITSSKYRTTVALALLDHRATPSTIAEQAGLDIAHVSRALTDLRERDVVELLVPEETKKGRIYGLTDGGTELVADNTALLEGEQRSEKEVMTDGGGFDITLDRTHVKDGDENLKEVWTATVDNAQAYDDMAGQTPGRALHALAREFDDVFGSEPRTDGGTGAVDHEFDEAERDASERLADQIADMDGRGHDRLQAGDVAIDLVKRQPLFVLERVADTVVDYFEETDFDLATYNQHHYLPVRPSDPVFECAFIGSLDDLHRFSDTYDYPAGRLARVPVELAGGGD